MSQDSLASKFALLFPPILKCETEADNGQIITKTKLCPLNLQKPAKETKPHNQPRSQPTT